MKRIFKFAGAAVVGLVVLALAGAAAVRFLLPPEKAGAILERQIESRLGREAELGALRFKGLSTLRVEGIRLSEAPTFATGTFLEADAVEVTASLLPLLFRRIVVREILLDRPKVTVVRAADGSFGADDPSPAARTPAGKPADLMISSVRLRGGSVTLVDRSTAALSAVIEPIDAELSHVSLVAPVAIQGAAGVRFRGVEATARFDASFDPLKGDAELTRFTVTASSAAVEATGRLRGAFAGNPDFNGTLSWTGLDPSSFTALIPLPEGLSVTGPTTGRLEATGTAPAVDSRFEADLTAARVRWKDIVDKEPGVPLTARMALDRGQSGDLNLHDLVVRLASVELRGGGTLKGSTETAKVAAFRVETNEFDVDDLFRHMKAYVPAGVSLSGPLRASVSMEGWTGGGRFVVDFDGTGLSAGYGDSFRKAPGTPLRLVADGRYATPIAVDFSSVRLDVDDLSMSGRGSYTTGKVRPTYVFRVKTNAFPLASIARLLPIAEPYRPSGRAVVNMRVSRGAQGPLIAGDATLLSASARMQTADVTGLAGRLTFTNDSVTAARLTGKVQGEPVVLSLKATRLAGRPLIEADIRATKLDIARLLPAEPQGTRAPRRFEWLPLVAVAHAADLPAAPFIFDTKGTLRASELVHPQYSGTDVQLAWNLTSVSAAMDAMSGTATLRHGSGAFRNLRRLVEGSKAARLLLGPLSLLQRVDAASGGALRIPSLENLRFTSISGDYVVKSGVAALSPMTLLAPALSSRMEGTVGLAGESPLDLTITLTARADQMEGAIGQALAAVDRNVTVRMKMTGTAADPKVSLDWNDLRKKAADTLQKIGPELFQKIFR